MVFKEAGSSSSYSLPPYPREDTPLLTNSPPLSSQFKTCANIFIAIVGAGVLGLPYTFKTTGYATGLIMLFIVAFLTYHCMLLLVNTRRKLESIMGFSKIKSFGDLGFSICGPFGRFSVDAMIVLSQAGFCVSYLIFIASTLSYLVAGNSTGETIPVFLGLTPKVLFLWGCFPFQLGLNSIKTLTHLAPLSIFADAVDITAKSVVMVEDVFEFMQNRPNLEAFKGFSVFFYGIGVAVYAFEGIGMVLPLESETKDKEKFGRVLGIGMGLISVLFGAFGALGYFAFGEETKDIITNNLGQGLISIVVQLGLCINLFITFPLMMNPVYEVFERRFYDSRYCLWIRWLLVLIVSLVALLVPNFADFLSLVGSSVCVVLGFVLPALFHCIVFRDELGWRCLVSDGAIMVFGFVVAVTGTYTSVSEILSPKA
ncbi:proton-coupled amino acid transporter 3-like protein [Trifolium pratense]|uniref:Proton-coupled amino acid transporter 3-like protein n=1 Tax=Trifolium pratense TaxID=57577 RepID=A0A2K3N8I3_TRIPR|nr:amino acid transporter AVT3C-like [Trifolium pratense]PNX99309.1 proton-coupled amino acid transporter 3-like protein [Trifolium pratense]